MEELGIMGALGLLLQWAKGPKAIPTWVAYCVFLGVALAAFVWQTPGIDTIFTQDWRKAVGMLGTFLLGIEGVTAAVRKARLAPKTDSL
jgi:hypothetical protein